MQVSVVHPDELGPAEIAAWRDMQRASTGLASPFLSPEFTLAVGRHRASARVGVLAEGGRVTGFFPFEERRLGLGVPIAAGLTDCQGLVHAPGFEWDPRDLLRGCRISAFQFDHLSAEQRPFQDYVSAAAPSPIIDLADGFPAYWAKLKVRSAHFRQDLARKERKLVREAGPVRLVAQSADRAALRSLMAWKSDQYRRTGRLDRFAQRWIVDLVDDLSGISGSHFSGLFSVLYVADEPVAAHFGVRSGPVLAQWFLAYDPAFGRYSVGLIQQRYMIEEAAALGVRLIDLGKGAKRYKETLKSSDIYVWEGAVTGRSPLALAHRARITGSHWAARTVRANPRLFQAADHALKRYGGLRATALKRARGQVPRDR